MNKSTEPKYTYVITPEGKRKRLKACPYHIKWRGILDRLSDIRFASYDECVICDEWKDSNVFRAWMETQDWEGKELDKDLIIKGNKIYGPDTCVFITPKLNKFLIAGEKQRGKYSIGVHKSGNKFVAQCCNPKTGKQEHLGRYETEALAHKAWRSKKHEHALDFAKHETDQRIIKALSTRYA